MKKLGYILLISALCISTLFTAQEGEPEGNPAEERAKLEEQKSKLEEEQKKLEEEQLSAQQRGDAQAAQSLEQQKQEVGQQISTVEQEIASVPDIGGGTSSGTGEQGGSIPVITTVTEQQIIAAHDVGDWQQEFKAFTETPGRFWGKGGRLFTEVPANQRADRLIEIIQQSPSSLFSENPFEGVEALASIAKLADTMRSRNSFTPDQSVRDYNRVMQALTSKLEEVIKDATFPEEPSITMEFDGYRKLMELVGDMPARYKSSLDRLILQKINDHLGTLIDTGKVGATPSDILDELSSGALQQALITAFDARFFSKEIEQAINTMLSQKMIDVFNKADLNSGTPQAFNSLAKKLLDNISSALKANAQSTVAAKLADYLASTPLSSNLNEAFNTLAKRYTDSIGSKGIILSNKLDLSQADLQKAQEGVSKAIESLTSKALSLPPEDAFNTLLKMATDPAASEFFKQLPGSARSLVTNLDSALLTTLNSHTATDALSPTTDNAQGSYVDAYNKQFRQLKDYLESSQSLGQGSESIEAQAAAIERITRLGDFADAQKSLYSNKKNKNALSKLGKNVSTLLKSEEGKKASDALVSQAPTFEKAEAEQQKLFSLRPLTALPEDMLASLDRRTTDLIDRISKTTDQKALKDLYAQLEQAYEDLTSPLIKTSDKTYGYEDLLIIPSDQALFKDLSQRVDKALGTRKEALEANVKQLGEIRTTIEKTIPGLQDATLETIGTLKPALDELSKSLDAITEHALPQEMIPVFQRTEGQVSAWSSIIATAEDYQAFTSKETTREQAAQAYISLMGTGAGLPVDINYGAEPVFTDRLQAMQGQQEALEKLTSLLREPKVTIAGKQYDLIQVGQFMERYAEYLENVGQDTLDGLAQNGFVQVKTSVVDGQEVKSYTATDRGLYLASTATLVAKLDRRAEQLDTYRKNNPAGKQPDLTMLINGRPIEIAEAYDLKLFILDDQVAILKWLYRRNFIPGRVEAAAEGVVATSPLENPPSLTQKDRKELLQGISDVLTVQRDELKTESVDPYFEALIETEAKIADLPAEEQEAARQKAGLKDMITNVMILSDPEAALAINDTITMAESKSIFQELMYVINEGIVSVSLRWDAAVQNWSENAATVAWYSILPAAIGAFFTTKIAVGYGTPVLGATVGTAIGGVVGTVVGGVVGSAASETVSTVTGLIAGIATAGSLYMLSTSLEPSQEQREDLRKRMVEAGYKPEDLEKRDPGWIQKGIAFARSFITSDLTKMVEEAVEYQAHVQDKVKTADMARDQLYALLELQPDARAVDVEAAFKKIEARLNERFFLKRWLTQRRLTQAYRFMLDTRQDALQAQMVHNQLLARITMKTMAQIADNNTSEIKKTFSKFKNFIGSIWSKFAGTAQGEEPLTSEQISQLGQELIDSYKGQLADMIALEKLIAEQAGTIDKASPWGDNTLTKTFRDVFNNRTKELTDEYQKNVNRILKEWGYAPIGTQ